MEKFSYLEAFNHVVTEGFSTDRIGGKPENFIIEVGEREPRTFLNSGEFYCIKFSTHSDVENALELVRRTLGLIDDSVSLQTDNAELLTIIRDDVIKAVGKKFDDAPLGSPKTRANVEAAINDILNYYIDIEKGITAEYYKKICAESKAVERSED